MPPEPLDYMRPFGAGRRRTGGGGSDDEGPRLSKLAVGAMVTAFAECLLMCGPLPALVSQLFVTSWVRPILFFLPAITMILCVVALLRILRSMDRLRGEGLAIAGIIASLVLCVIIVVID